MSILSGIAKMKARLEYTPALNNTERVIFLSTELRRALCAGILMPTESRPITDVQLQVVREFKSTETLFGMRMVALESPTLEKLYGPGWWFIGVQPK